MPVEELANARLLEASSIFEWRFAPGRLDAELAAFLTETWVGFEARQATGAA